MVVVSWVPMSTNCVVIVGAGPLPERLMRQTCEELATRCALPLLSHGVGEPAEPLLNEWRNQNGLIRLSGDAARRQRQACSWLEALSDWKQPVLLLTAAEADGGIPGSAAAYTALCRELNIDLIGLIQLQSDWDDASRRQDGLPWFGWIPDKDHPDRDDGLEALAMRIRRRLKAVAKAAASVRA